VNDSLPSTSPPQSQYPARRSPLQPTRSPTLLPKKDLLRHVEFSLFHTEGLTPLALTRVRSQYPTAQSCHVVHVVEQAHRSVK